MSPSSMKDNPFGIETEGTGPHLFGPDDYREWLEAQIRSAVRAVLEEVLEAEISEHLGAGPSERTEGRRGYRNGSYTRGSRPESERWSSLCLGTVRAPSGRASSSDTAAWSLRSRRRSGKPTLRE